MSARLEVSLSISYYPYRNTCNQMGYIQSCNSVFTSVVSSTTGCLLFQWIIQILLSCLKLFWSWMNHAKCSFRFSSHHVIGGVPQLPIILMKAIRNLALFLRFQTSTRHHLSRIVQLFQATGACRAQILNRRCCCKPRKPIELKLLSGSGKVGRGCWIINFLS